jgi:hypothetical protein
VDIPCPGDWAQAPGWETFSGTICFHTTFELPGDQPPPHYIDLGRVGDIAEVRLNNRLVGVRAWAPYILDLAGAGRPGTNRLEVRITNSVANAYNGRQMPSGLIGPVCLRACGAGDLMESISPSFASESGARSTGSSSKD